jgi:hypothetical protein
MSSLANHRVDSFTKYLPYFTKFFTVLLLLAAATIAL